MQARFPQLGIKMEWGLWEYSYMYHVVSATPKGYCVLTHTLTHTHTHTLKDYLKKICSNKDADRENRLVDTAGDGKGGRN